MVCNVVERRKGRRRNRKRREGGRYLERAHEGIINTHHGSSIVKLPTVIGRTKDSD